MKTLTEHLRDRHLNLELHKPVLDEEDRVATFWLYNLTGQLVGFHQYRPDRSKDRQNDPRNSRYFTFRKLPTLAVWGVESLELTPGVVFLTEGVFDAARLTERGYSALAVLCNNPTHELRDWLKCLHRKVVAVCDNDKAGRMLAKFGNVAVFTEEKDLGDSSEEFVTNLLNTYA